MNPQNTTLQQQLDEQFKQLPQIVQNAITSADIEKHLRALADTQRLHLDQWQKLENEVMLTLLGIQQIESLQRNIQSEVGVTSEVAQELAESINKIVFEPIRQELERQLTHPDAQAKQVSDVEAARDQTLAGARSVPTAPSPSAPAVAPATPPAPALDVKVTRPSESTAYKPGETSAQRAAVHDDPYREPPK
ncbi:MAG: hypothetical protein AAB908_00545 [Patescibacteria group bacterium]